jgi:hypothetical protein
MSDYNENNNIFPDIEKNETTSSELEQEKEPHDLEIDVSKYGINKPSRIEIKAKVIHGKGKKNI